MQSGVAQRLDLPSPESFLDAISSTLEKGHLSEGREIAADGLSLFPGHPELERLYHGLRPVTVRRGTGNIPDRRQAFRWLQENIDRFRGQWVALSEERVVAASPSLDEVLRSVEAIPLKNPLLFHFVT